MKTTMKDKQLFELNEKLYSTDSETLAVLRSIIPSAKAIGDSSAVQTVIAVGLKTGRIEAINWVVIDK